MLAKRLSAAVKIDTSGRALRRSFGNYEKLSSYSNTAMKNLKVPGVTLVRNGHQAEEALRVLYKLKNRFANKSAQLGHRNHRF